MEPISLVIAALAVLVGAFARGFSGFGSGMIWAGGLSLVLPPLVVVPVIWRSLRWLLLGRWSRRRPGFICWRACPAILCAWRSPS